MKKNQKLSAFTLAETLITLMVIGVIAVMTIPTLKDHSDEVKYVTAAKKAYASVTAATTTAEAKHTDSFFWNFLTGRNKVIKWYKEALNTMPQDASESWKVIYLDGSVWMNNFRPDFVTADGMAWLITDGGYGCGGAVIIDTNGAQQPNTIGIDIHGYRVGNDSCKASDYGVFPMGDNRNDFNTSWACTSYAIKHGSMPWFREPGTYSSCTSFAGS